MIEIEFASGKMVCTRPLNMLYDQAFQGIVQVQTPIKNPTLFECKYSNEHVLIAISFRSTAKLKFYILRAYK